MTQVLHLYHYLRDFPADAPRVNGGLQKAVAGLAKGIVDVSRDTAHRNLQCTVLCEGERAVEVVRPEGFRVRCFDNATTQSKRFALAPSLREFVLDDLEFDSVVVLHAIFHASVWMMSRLLRQRNIRYVVAPHDPYHPTMFANGWLKKTGYWHLCERPMLRHAHAVQVLDRRHDLYLRQRRVKTPVIEVGNGYASDDVPDEWNLVWTEEGPVRILFLGRLDPNNKGLDLLIDAFAKLSETHPDARLTLQGPDNGEGNAIRARIDARGLASRAEVLGPDYTTRPADLAAQYDLFALPSRFEGFGLSAMEAMLAARPVLISDIAGLSPHVRACDGGAVVDATVESIHAGLQQLIARRSEWREIGMRGRQHVMENLGWEKIAAGALADYREIAAR